MEQNFEYPIQPENTPQPANVPQPEDVQQPQSMPQQENMQPQSMPQPENTPAGPQQPEYTPAGPQQPNYYTGPVYTGPTYTEPSYGPSGPVYTPVEPQQKKPKKKHKGLRTVALILVCALVGGLAGFGGSFLNSGAGSSEKKTSTILEGVRESAVIDIAHIDTSKELTAAEVYAANVNSTVGITTSITTNYWGYQTTSAASGSGLILTSDGYILTNYHVIEDSDSITVSLYDGTTYNAALIGYDKSNDIAVLKVDAENLPPVILGDSDNLNVGDSVVAIGNPLGELTFSLTAGAVSALDREVTLSGNLTMDLIQTDCAINSGNSGGPLFNMYGEVIGITNAKYSGSGSSSEASIDNIGFAIPINHVKGIVEDIIEDGYITKPYIGVTVTDVSAETQRYGLPKGAAIVSVSEDSPAEEAGLKENDIVTAVNGVEITDRTGLSDAVSACEPGDKLVLSVYRQGQTLEITVTVGKQTQSALAQEEEQSSQQGYPGGFPWGHGFGG